MNGISAPTLLDLHHDLHLTPAQMHDALLKAMNEQIRERRNDVWPTLVEAHELTETIRHLLWHFVGVTGGWRPGQFTEYLINAIAIADRVNFGKLALVYPTHCALFRHVQLHGAWILQRAVGEV